MSTMSAFLLLVSWFQPFLGVGTYRDGARPEINCEDVAIEFTALEERFIRLSSRYVCDGKQIGSPTGVLENRGGELWTGGRKVGNVTEKKIQIEIVDGVFISRFTGDIGEDGSLLWLDVRETPTRRSTLGAVLYGSTKAFL